MPYIQVEAAKLTKEQKERLVAEIPYGFIYNTITRFIFFALLACILLRREYISLISPIDRQFAGSTVFGNPCGQIGNCLHCLVGNV